MLKTILDKAGVRGWLDRDTAYETAIYLSQGATFSVMVSQSGTPQLFLKASTHLSLATEADRFALANTDLPRFAPGFAGYDSSPGLEVVATRALASRAITISLAHRSSKAKKVREAIIDYFAETSRAARLQERDIHGGPEILVSHFAGTPLGDLVQMAVRDTKPLLEDLRPVRQHGDFVINNLALDDQDRLVVFDWEDYGVLSIPGLDLFTLEFSLHHEAALMRGRGQACHPERLLDTAACARAIGLTPETHAQLRLLHALGFLYIKRHYGPDVRARLETLIGSLARDHRALVA